jgi:hypothetical protein
MIEQLNLHGGGGQARRAGQGSVRVAERRTSRLCQIIRKVTTSGALHGARAREDLGRKFALGGPRRFQRRIEAISAHVYQITALLLYASSFPSAENVLYFTQKWCDRVRSVGAYWVVSQRALCSSSFGLVGQRKLIPDFPHASPSERAPDSENHSFRAFAVLTIGPSCLDRDPLTVFRRRHDA